MKTILLARHGQTIFNAARRYQFSDTPLSELGTRQAGLLAARLRDQPIRIVLSSTMKRAVDTATPVASALSVPLVQCGLLGERLRPSAQFGRPFDDQEMIELSRRVHAEFGLETHISDEENFSDLKQRVEMALAMLDSRPEDFIAVVSHGFFMRVLLARMMLGPNLTAAEAALLERAIKLDNASITSVTYDPAAAPPYKLIGLNDHSHLL